MKCDFCISQALLYMCIVHLWSRQIRWNQVREKDVDFLQSLLCHNFTHLENIRVFDDRNIHSILYYTLYTVFHSERRRMRESILCPSHVIDFVLCGKEYKVVYILCRFKEAIVERKTHLIPHIRYGIVRGFTCTCLLW